MRVSPEDLKSFPEDVPRVTPGGGGLDPRGPPVIPGLDQSDLSIPFGKYVNLSGLLLSAVVREKEIKGFMCIPWACTDGV